MKILGLFLLLAVSIALGAVLVGSRQDNVPTEPPKEQIVIEKIGTVGTENIQELEDSIKKMKNIDNLQTLELSKESKNISSKSIHEKLARTPATR